MEQQVRNAPQDLQEHLERLEARGLLTRIDRAINKDTELHPLARWQFQGGLREEQRRGFLFTNVTGAKGERYDIPVAAGVLAASAEIYAAGLGVPVDAIGDLWVKAMAHPIAPEMVDDAPCQEVVMTGDALTAPGGGLASLPVPISTPGFDSAPYLTATLCVTRDPENGIRNMGTYRGALKAQDRLGVRMASRLSGAGGYQHWLKYQKRGEPMPVAIVIGCAPAVLFTGPQKLPLDVDEMGVAGGLMGAPVRITRCRTIDLEVPADAEIVIEGLVDTTAARAGRPVRRKPRPRRARGLQHVDAGDRDHPQEEAGLRLHHQPGDAERVERAQARRLRAAVPVAPEIGARHPRHPPGGDARAAEQSAQGHLPAVRPRRAAHRSLARPARGGHAAGTMRQDRHRGFRRYRCAQRRRGVLVARLPRQHDRRRARHALPLRRPRPQGRRRRRTRARC